MTRWLRRLLAYIGITIGTREISIKVWRWKITIKSERSDPNEETQRHIERKQK